MFLRRNGFVRHVSRARNRITDLGPMTHEPRHACSPSHDFPGDRHANFCRTSRPDIQPERHTHAPDVRFGITFGLETIPRLGSLSPTPHSTDESKACSDRPLDGRLIDLMVVRHDQRRDSTEIARHSLPDDGIVVFGVENCDGLRAGFVLGKTRRIGCGFARIAKRHGKTERREQRSQKHTDMTRSNDEHVMRRDHRFEKHFA